MLNKVTSIWREKGLEEGIFAAILVGAVPYFLTAIINGIMSGAPWQAISIAIALLLLVFVTIYYGRIYSYSKWVILGFNVLITLGFLAFWPLSSGVTGGAGYIFMSLSIVLLLTSRKKGRLITAALLLAIIAFMASEVITPTGHLSYDGILTDFFANLLLISLLMILFKIMFDQKEEELRSQVEQLTLLNEQVTQQSETMEKNREEILEIRNNLKAIIEERTKTYQQRNQEIVDYAFINAHLLRAPLTNIIAITRLPDLDGTEYKELAQHVEELDSVIKKIAGILAVASEYPKPSDNIETETF